jgi:hypothetical protein
MAFPNNWANTFGSNYYSQMQAKELALLNKNDEWKTNEEGKPYLQSELNVTSSDEVQNNIQNLLNDMEQEITND